MLISRARALALLVFSIHIVSSYSPAFAQGPPEGLGVNVVNEVSIRNADNPAFQAITITFRAQGDNATAGGGYVLSGAGYTVPSGKVLVIERATGQYSVDGSNPFKVQLTLAELVPGESTVFHFIGISSETMQCSLGSMCAGIGQQAKTYIKAGHSLRPDGHFQFTAATSRYVFSGTINGYLVNIPES